ncbi:MAG: methyltransferase domain-containing protein [Balneolaceae bacterium]|jgi:demethylmenaquinone methyltransferase/2-methoxy-6-polyprenyl-1,4-benzoquinol methylase
MDEKILSKSEITKIYSNWASKYDLSVGLFCLLGFRVKAYREKAVSNLALQRGQTVVDLGCGTGLNFELLQKEVGPEGRIIGVDLSDAMLDQARQRVEKKGWSNVELIKQDIYDYEFPDNTDGILSTLALTMSPNYDEIIQQAADKLGPGKRMSIFELKRPEKWPEWLVNAMIWLLKSYGTRPEHTKRKPWLSMEKYFSKSMKREFYAGAVYVATGMA